jgi:lipopolysaccharide transport system ATP-binding protein
MSDIAVKVENLSKSYRVGHRAAAREKYSTLRDVIAQGARNWVRQAGDLLSGRAIIHGDEIEEFWALKDVNIAIRQGERVGIIGHNGAGKSTLLKILSRITEPSAGRVTLNGRVASLLEVGTGFHPELSGRENIFLNGTILGMSRQEIRRKFDEIVDFSQVEKFLDTPVKRYSSGMYVRLAFAVAAHLEPDVLVVDEVLAVGDASFQRRCLKKMDDVSKNGRTILFVSHKMDAVRRLCDRAILLEGGRLSTQGETEAVVKQYLSAGSTRAYLDDRGRAPHKCMHVRWAKLVDERGKLSSHCDRGQPLTLQICYEVNQVVTGAHAICLILDKEDRVIFSTGDCDIGDRTISTPREPGLYLAMLSLPTQLLNEDDYTVAISLSVPFGTIHDRVNDGVGFAVADPRQSGGPEYAQRRPGAIVVDLPWHTTRVASISGEPNHPQGN